MSIKSIYIIIFLFLIYFQNSVSYVYFMQGSISYDTLQGKTVTKDNIGNFLEVVPQEVFYGVTNFFQQNQDLYHLLVQQDGYLENIGSMYINGRFLLERCFKSLGCMNYVFKLPNQNLLVKISWPLNRLLTTMKNRGFGEKKLYLRIIEDKPTGTNGCTMEYLDFDEDKQKIRKHFYASVSKEFLQQVPTKEQLRMLIDLISGAMARARARGIVRTELIDTYLKHETISSYDSIEEAFEQFLDYAYQLLPRYYYKKSDLSGKKLDDTYNSADRMFRYLRFQEAIRRYNLYALEDPPQSYLINVHAGKFCSFSDKDAVFVQEISEHRDSLRTYMKHGRATDDLFDNDVITQLFIAVKYAGLWDPSLDNIFVHKDTKKITYIDFENVYGIPEAELFNKDKKRLQENLYYAYKMLVDLFPQKQDLVVKLIQETDDIDFFQYVAEKRDDQEKWYPRLAKSVLGELLFFDDPDNIKAASKKEALYRAVKSVS